jgi:hypothetical protein
VADELYLSTLERKQLQRLSPKELYCLDVIVRSGIADSFSAALKELYVVLDGEKYRS